MSVTKELCGNALYNDEALKELVEELDTYKGSYASVYLVDNAELSQQMFNELVTRIRTYIATT